MHAILAVLATIGVGAGGGRSSATQALPRQQHVDTVVVSRQTLEPVLLDSTACRSPDAGRGFWPTPPSTVQAASAALMADDRVALMDLDAEVMRLFAPDGRELARLGRRGAGPGEFGQLAFPVRWDGDTIAVLDPQYARISLFTAQGFASTFSAREVEGLASASYTGRLDDGTMLFVRFGSLTDAKTSPSRPRFTLVRWRPGMPAHALVRDSLLGSTFHQITSGGRAGVVRANFPRTTSIAAVGDRIALYDNAVPRVEILDRSGTTVRVVSLDVRDPPVSAEDRDTALARWRQPRAPLSNEAMRLQIWFPETRPAATWHGADARAGFWMGFHPPTARGSAVYVRFTSEGAPDRCLRPAAGTRLIAFGADRVVTVVQTDERDVIDIERAARFPVR